jgi:arsenate reductase
MTKSRVLFLCVHNSGRSQMAEALLRQLAGDEFEVESAGFEPRPILPEAVLAMRAFGVDVSAASSKAVFDLYRAGRIFDFVITVCDEASAEQCPIFPGVCERLHWTFPDPSAAQGTPEERLAQVMAIRDAIRARIEAWLGEVRLQRSGLRLHGRGRGEASGK